MIIFLFKKEIVWYVHLEKANNRQNDFYGKVQ